MKKACIFALVFVLTACMLAACRRMDSNPTDGTGHSSAAPTVTSPIPTETAPSTEATRPSTEHTTPGTDATEHTNGATDDTGMPGTTDTTEGSMEGRSRRHAMRPY